MAANDMVVPLIFFLVGRGKLGGDSLNGKKGEGREEEGSEQGLRR